MALKHKRGRKLLSSFGIKRNVCTASLKTIMFLLRNWDQCLRIILPTPQSTLFPSHSHFSFQNLIGKRPKKHISLVIMSGFRVLFPLSVLEDRASPTSYEQQGTWCQASQAHRCPPGRGAQPAAAILASAALCHPGDHSQLCTSL